MVSEAERAFWRGGLGEPALIGRLPYEPRAVRHCEDCDSVLVGTKDGRIFIEQPDAQNVGQPTELASALGFIEIAPGDVARSGVRTLIGCPVCPIGAWIGDALGNVLRIDTGGLPAHPEAWRIVTIRDAQRLAKSPGRVVAIETISGVLFVHHEDGSLIEIGGSDGAWNVTPRLPRGQPYRWITRDADAEGSSLWMIGADGFVARWAPGDVSPRSAGHLRHDPSSLATERVGGTLQALFSGWERGVEIWWPRHRGDRSVALAGLGSVRFVRRLPYFPSATGEPRWRMVACNARGRVATWAWTTNTLDGLLTRGVADEPPRTPWPLMRDEVLAVIFGAKDRFDATGLKWRRALCFLRNHEVYRLPIFDERLLRDSARAADSPLSSTARGLLTGTTDPARLATFVRDLDRPTLDQLRTAMLELSWPDRSGQPVDVGYEPRDLVSLGVAIMAQAHRFSPEAVRDLARWVRTQTLRQMRSARASDPEHPHPHGDDRWLVVVRWTRFLRKHFLLAHTYDDKDLQVAHLLEVNRRPVGGGLNETNDAEKPSSAIDGLIYAARIKHEGFIVEERWRLDAAVTALATRTIDGKPVLAAALRDGSIVRFDAASPPTGEPSVAPLRPTATTRSDVLVGDAHAWWYAPQARARDAGLAAQPADAGLRAVRIPVPPGAAGRRRRMPGDHDIHAMAAAAGGWLLTLRARRTPRAWLAREPDTTPKLIDVPDQWGPGVGRPRQRVALCLNRDATHDPCFLLGGDDGVLRVVRIVTSQDRLHAVVLSRLPLGRPIHCGLLHPVSSQPGRSPIVVIGTGGTRGGEFLAFKIRGCAPDHGRPELILAYRDWLAHAVVDMCWVSGHHEVAVLDESGRVAWQRSEITPERKAGGRDSRIPDDRAWRRVAHCRVMDVGAALAAGDHGTLFVAGRVGDRPELRQIRRATEAERTIDPRLVDAAIQMCCSSADLRGPDRRNPPATAIPTATSLLLALPHRDGAVRAALVGKRLGKAWTNDAFAALVADAVQARPDDRVEFKAALDYAVAHSRAGVDARSRRERLAIVTSLGVPGQGGPWRNSAKRRAALARKMMCPDLIAMCSPIETAARGTDDILAHEGRGWMEDLLFDDDPLVRLVAVQSLSAALHEIVEVDRASPGARLETFPPYPAPGAPAVTGAAWLIDLIARFLRDFSPEVESEFQCGIEAASAMLALFHLLALYPEAVMTILHQLAVIGVDAAVFRIVRKRLDAMPAPPEAIAPVVTSVKLYAPWSSPPVAADVMGYTLTLHERAAQIEPGTPDDARLRVQCCIYDFLAQLARADSPDEIQHADLAALDGDDAQVEAWLAQPDWDSRGPAAGGRLFAHTIGWLKEHVGRLQRKLAESAPDAVDPISRGPRDLRDEVLGAALTPGQICEWRIDDTKLAELFEPERGAMTAILQQWRSVFTDPTPRPGQSIHGWTLGAWIGKQRDPKRRTFEVAIAPPPWTARDLLIQSHSDAPPDRLKAERARFHQLLTVAEAPALQGTTTLPLVAALPRGQQTWLVMRHLREEDGWGALAGDNPIQALRDRGAAWVPLLAGWVEAIAGALNLMHDHGVCHGDVDGQNVLVRGDRAALIDYESVGFYDGQENVDSLRRTLPRPALPPRVAMEFRDAPGDQVVGYQRDVATDAARLFELAVETAQQAAWQHQRWNPRQMPSGEEEAWVRNLPALPAARAVEIAERWPQSRALLARYRAALDRTLRAPWQPPRQPIDVFLCYCRDDLAIARQFKQRFVQQGWRVWLDDDEIRGDDVDASCWRAVSTSRLVVVLRGQPARTYQMKEIQTAMVRADHGHGLVAPVILLPATPLHQLECHLGLKHVHDYPRDGLAVCDAIGRLLDPSPR